MPQDQTLLGGETKVSDMIGDDAVVAEDGKVYGKIKFIKNFVEFSPDKPELQSGNYFPIQLSEDYDGQMIVLKRDGTERKRAEDLDWIVRIQSPETVYRFETVDGTEIITLDFTTAKVQGPEVGEKAISVPLAGTHMDAVDNSNKLIDDNVKIKWSGTDGEVIGHIHYYHFGDEPENTGHFTDAPHGHYFPLLIKHYDGEEITVVGSKEQEAKKVDPKWIVRVDDFKKLNKKAIFKWKDTVLASLDFSKAILDPPPVNKVVIPRTDDTKHGKSFNKPVSEFSENLVLDDKGKMTGTLKYVTNYEHTFPEEEEHEGNWLLLHFDKDVVGTEDIKCGINNIVDTDKGDFNTNFKLTQDKLSKPVIVEIDQGAIRYEIDISELELKPKDGDV